MALDLGVGFNGNALSRTFYGTTLSGGATGEGGFDALVLPTRMCSDKL